MILLVFLSFQVLHCWLPYPRHLKGPGTKGGVQGCCFAMLRKIGVSGVSVPPLIPFYNTINSSYLLQ
jgi:hypothetical protein